MEVFIYLSWYNKDSEERVAEMNAIFFWYLLFVTTKKQGIRPRWFFVYECVFVCVSARVCDM